MSGDLTVTVSAAFLQFGRALRKTSEVLEEFGLALILGEAYDPQLIADFERDSGGTVEEIERAEEELGVTMP